MTDITTDPAIDPGMTDLGPTYEIVRGHDSDIGAHRYSGRGLPPLRDAGTLHVITAAAPTSGIGGIAAYEGSDISGTSVGLADGLAVRVADRRSMHAVATRADWVNLRFLPAAALTNPRANLAVVMPDGWNAMTGAVAGFSVAGLDNEVRTVEALGFNIRHRLSVHASPATTAVHFGTLAEVLDVSAAARDVLRAGGMVQVEAGSGTALDALAAVGIPPWAGWVARFDMTIVVPCGPAIASYPAIELSESRDINVVARLASEAVRRTGGPALAQFGSTLSLALADVDKAVPGVAGWTTEWAKEADAERNESANSELAALINAVQNACDGEVDVELVGTGPGTVIDLR